MPVTLKVAQAKMVPMSCRRVSRLLRTHLIHMSLLLLVDISNKNLKIWSALTSVLILIKDWHKSDIAAVIWSPLSLLISLPLRYVTRGQGIASQYRVPCQARSATFHSDTMGLYTCNASRRIMTNSGVQLKQI